MTLLECRALNKSYQSELKQETQVLKQLQLVIEQQEQVAILGQSGSGKSTLLHLLAMLDQPTSGQMLFMGKDTANLSENDKAAIRNKHMGFIYQFHHLLMEFSALENVAMPLLIQGMDRDDALKQAHKWLKLVGLEHRVEHTPAALSGGERQRVAIARALVNKPKLVLADEPTGNLDKQNAEQIFDLFLELNKKLGTTLIVVTHDQQLASRFNRVIKLDDGHIVG